jgi:hypothetical protein
MSNRQEVRQQALGDLLACDLIEMKEYLDLSEKVGNAENRAAVEAVIARFVPAGWTAEKVFQYVHNVGALFHGRGQDIFRGLREYFAADFHFELRPPLDREKIESLIHKFHRLGESGHEDESFFTGFQLIPSPFCSWRSLPSFAYMDLQEFWAQVLAPETFQVLFGLIKGIRAAELYGKYVFVYGLFHQEFKDIHKLLPVGATNPQGAFLRALELKFAALIINRPDVADLVDALLEFYRAGNLPAGFTISEEGTRTLYLYARGKN